MIDSSVAFNYLRDSIGPISTLFIVISMYSLVSNCLFGHQTFWKPKHVLNTMKKVISSGSLPASGTDYPLMIKNLDKINDDMVISCMSYLNAKELHSISKVSKRCKDLSNYSILWSNLLNLAYFDSFTFMRVIALDRLPSMRNKDLFYKLKPIFGALLIEQLKIRTKHESEPIYVILHGTVLNLTQFSLEHPGGFHVLHDVADSDATQKFELANHSDLAIELSKNFLVWSAEEIFG